MSPVYALSHRPSLSLVIYLTRRLSHFSSYAAGQYDLCGFPKAAAFWYRMQWLTTIPDGPDKTFYVSTPSVRITALINLVVVADTRQTGSAPSGVLGKS